MLLHLYKEIELKRDKQYSLLRKMANGQQTTVVVCESYSEKSGCVPEVWWEWGYGWVSRQSLTDKNKK